MKVRVYFNLHRKQLSVQHKTPSGWRLWRHAEQVTLENPRFRVSEPGRQRVLREKRKNVHALIEGDLVLTEGAPITPATAVTYNPYKMATFQTVEAGEPVRSAKYAIINGRKILAEI
jgi:hypothetical protein